LGSNGKHSVERLNIRADCPVRRIAIRGSEKGGSQTLLVSSQRALCSFNDRSHRLLDIFGSQAISLK